MEQLLKETIDENINLKTEIEKLKQEHIKQIEDLTENYFQNLMAECKERFKEIRKNLKLEKQIINLKNEIAKLKRAYNSK